ncbi:MAG: hypothetical protein ACXVEB_17485 [Bacteroidia bacterium]
MKRAAKERKRLKTYLGRVYRDIKNKIVSLDIISKAFEPILEIIEKVLSQTRESKNKIYSIHEPHVECISKGKLHKKYEFGCKVSLVVTHKDGLALSLQGLHGNPYDGHTLKFALQDAQIDKTSKKMKNYRKIKFFRLFQGRLNIILTGLYLFFVLFPRPRSAQPGL